jgi:hypothetical protein
LKEKREEVTPQCFAHLRKRERLDVVMPENDYSLMSKCGSVIQVRRHPVIVNIVSIEFF